MDCFSEDKDALGINSPRHCITGDLAETPPDYPAHLAVMGQQVKPKQPFAKRYTYRDSTVSSPDVVTVTRLADQPLGTTTWMRSSWYTLPTAPAIS